VSVYWDILAAVRTKIRSVTEIGLAEVKIRPKPLVINGTDTLPLVLVCPRKDSWEGIPDLQFDNNCIVAYPVLVGVVIEGNFDQDGLKWQLNVRDAIRRKLFNPTVLQSSVPSVFDVVYEPNPRGVDMAALAAHLDLSFQQFTWSSSEARDDT